MDVIRKIDRRNNMDVVRYYLALSVVIAHYNLLTGHSIPWPTSSYSAVGGFFALSGYLIFHSYLKCTDFRSYITARMRRILPPYMFIVVACAAGLVFASDLTPAQYFTDSGLIKYLAANLSFLNFLHPTLPGVFQGQEFVNPAVNGSLWTMKIEWALYLSVPLIYFLYRHFKWNRTITLIAIIILSVTYRLWFYHLYVTTGNNVYEILSRQFFGQLCYFYTGVLVYFHFDRFIRYKWWIAAVCAIFIIIGKYIPYYNMTLQPFVDAFATLWVSLVGSWGCCISRHDNVSYDMYLFHYPIIQAGVFLGINTLPEPLSFLAVLVMTVIMSALSWNIVGRHFMKSKKKATG